MFTFFKSSSVEIPSTTPKRHIYVKEKYNALHPTDTHPQDTLQQLLLEQKAQGYLEATMEAYRYRYHYTTPQFL